MQKGKKALLILAAVCMLSGCGQSGGAEISSVTIGKDGSIAHQIVGGFEQNYYDIGELKSLAADRVSEYCEENGPDRVKLASVEDKEGTISIRLDYATAQDYSNFNHRELYIGTLSSAIDEGYPLEAVPFVSAEGEPMEIGFIEDWDKKQIAIIATKPSEELAVNTYGKVLYINQNLSSPMDVSFTGKKNVRIMNPAGEDADEATLSYIIFE